ncbi:HEAT repeat domain-containing protein [Paenibacillus sp. SYP-B3998]|uniref:HEAT repeat domain-containing protein n=1 Tax=Paenibacillus sp. SYP-B3998 TaxID=2678564 RepID=A0A6G3ZSW8_9BACL|nr:HEAT repeat domain-containing protein [Paenibacillus sp. SYP-B3998]NEW04681.1 HEAT repeat domain-containing protein [Paenibacillus sp. SYP-B3998]
MKLNELQIAINENNIDLAISIVEEIGNTRVIEAVPVLIHFLLNTEENILRNAIAIALSDIGSEEAVEPLISLLKSPKTIKSRGTILYALESFDCSVHAELLLDLLINGNFEVSRQAFLLLDSNVSRISNQMKVKCLKIIREEIKKQKNNTEILLELVEIFK